MAKKLIFKSHIQNASDLVTSKEQTRAGFISLALEKNYISGPYVAEARALKNLALNAKRPTDLLKIQKLEVSLLTASGMSDKAMNHLTDKDKIESIKGLIKNFLEPSGKDFVNELVYRYLLIKGDSLGGKLRNLAGKIGELKFVQSLLSVLNVYNINYKWMDVETYQWKNKIENQSGIEKRIKGFQWQNSLGSRILLININVPLVKKNVDLCLLTGNKNELQLKGNNQNSIHRNADRYISVGEIKGGIDPAGADEHWKTANSALERIRNSFKTENLFPKTFFIGAAIENSMAQEIFNQLCKKTLANACNLTVDQQLISICDWLINL